MKKKNILVIAAHPDDELLGCGGTILKHTEIGDKVHVVIVAEGITSRQKIRNRNQVDTELKELKDSTLKVSNLLSISSFEILNFPDNRLDSVELLELIKKLEDKISLISPEIIYTHHHGDLNIDHKLVNEAVITACRPVKEKNVKKIFSFEIPSSTDWQLNNNENFHPNYFVDITNQLEKKICAMKFYQSELRDWPHSRSIKGIESLAYIRGMQAGFQAAESFMLLRELVD